MRIAGKRFWTLVSVAVLSLFARVSSGVFAQEKTPDYTTSPTTQSKHNAPPGPNSKIRTVQDKRKDKWAASSASKLSTSNGQKTTPITQKITGSNSYPADASSKDAAKMTSRLKTTSAQKISSGVKTKGGG